MAPRLSIVAAVFLMMFGLGRLSAIPACAGGGVNWQVKVKNPTPWECTITVFRVLGTSMNSKISAGGETTFNTGTFCPGGLWGYCMIRDPDPKALRLQQTDMNGTPMEAEWGGASCWNHNITICKKKGDDANPQNGDYSFCKE